MKCISIWPIVGVSEVVFALYLILAVQYVLVYHVALLLRENVEQQQSSDRKASILALLAFQQK